MTKQEAIEILRDTPIDIRSTREDDIHTLYATAQGMAIEALSCSEKPNRSDTIYRQDAKDRLTVLVNEIESIFADIRERDVDDSVCGLCEYDCDHGIDGSAFECLGFERDDCFKLKDEYREEWTDVKVLPSAQPERKTDKSCDGCAFVGCYETDFPCAVCERRNKDYYTPTPKIGVERRTDE